MKKAKAKSAGTKMVMEMEPNMGSGKSGAKKAKGTVGADGNAPEKRGGGGKSNYKKFIGGFPAATMEDGLGGKMAAKKDASTTGTGTMPGKKKTPASKKATKMTVKEGAGSTFKAGNGKASLAKAWSGKKK